MLAMFSCLVFMAGCKSDAPLKPADAALQAVFVPASVGGLAIADARQVALDVSVTSTDSVGVDVQVSNLKVRVTWSIAPDSTWSMAVRRLAADGSINTSAPVATFDSRGIHVDGPDGRSLSPAIPSTGVAVGPRVQAMLGSFSASTLASQRGRSSRASLRRGTRLDDLLGGLLLRVRFKTA